MGPQTLLHAPLQPISICLWEAVLHSSQIGIPLSRLALGLREWPQLLSGTGCCSPYFPSSPHKHCRPWLLLLHQPPHQNLELSGAGEAPVNHVVSLGQKEGDGLWSWTELALNPSSVTSRQDVLIRVCGRVSGSSGRWAPQDPTLSWGLAVTNGKCLVQGWT